MWSSDGNVFGRVYDHSSFIYFRSSLQSREGGNGKRNKNDDFREEQWYKDYCSRKEEAMKEHVIQSHYDELGLKRDTISVDEVKKAYKAKALRVHPDKCLDKRRAEDEFKRLQDAYDAIMNLLQCCNGVSHG